MKKVVIFILLSVLISMLTADIKVQYSGADEYYQIPTFKSDNINYLYLSDLNYVLNGQIKEVLIDDRVNFTIFKTEISFCIESSYAHVTGSNSSTMRDEYFNFYYPIIYKDGNYSVPVHFAMEIIPIIFPDKFAIEDEFLIVNQENSDPIDVIVLDPGHGGKDPGAVGRNGLQEKKLTLEIAKKLKKRIEKELNVKVLLTRSNDSFVSLRNRTDYANNESADLFVSLHCNAAKNKKATGIEVYYLSEAKTDESRAAQALENSVVEQFEGKDALKNYKQADYVVSDMIQSAQLMESITLAYKAQTNLVTETKAKDRGVKSANFYVLRGAYMPAVLVEMGFISNKTEGKLLNTSKQQEKIIESLFYAIKSFKINFDRNNCLE